LEEIRKKVQKKTVTKKSQYMQTQSVIEESESLGELQSRGRAKDVRGNKEVLDHRGKPEVIR
jgi:hypothetical protein